MSIYACNFSYKELGKKIRPALKKYYRIPDKFISFSFYQKRIFRDMAQDTLEVLSRGASKASPAEEERYLGKFYQGTNFEKEFWDQAYGSRR